MDSALVVLDYGALKTSASSRGLTVSELFREARLSKTTQTKVAGGQPVRASVARLLDEVISRIPELSHVVVEEV